MKKYLYFLLLVNLTKTQPLLECQFEESNYEYFMTITAIIDNINNSINGNEWELSAYHENNCRGEVLPILHMNQWIYFLMIHGNDENEYINLRLNNVETDSAYQVFCPFDNCEGNEFLFQSNSTLGSPTEPILLYTTYIEGCQDVDACNYDILASVECDDCCEYSEEYYDCTGECISDIDNDSVCDQLEISGCMDELAYNYDSTATDNEGCIYLPIANFEYNIVNATVQFIDFSYGFSSPIIGWNWDFGDGNNSNFQSPIKIYEDIGEYVVSLDVVDSLENQSLIFSTIIFINNLKIDNILVNQFEIEKISPNPFNPTTSISFSIPKQSQTSIKVFDIKGNLISTLLNESINVGYHQIEWNAEGYPSGVYFVKLDAGEFTQTQKLMLVK